MTHIFQPLDLSGNAFAKRFTKDKFNKWYTDQVIRQMDQSKDVQEINIKLRLSILKPLHTQWMTDLYNRMTTEEGNAVIKAGWGAAGIADAIEIGVANLPSLDPFNVIDPLIELTCSEHNMQEALNQQRMDQIELEKSLMEKEGNEDDEGDDEYVLENRNAFELFEDEFVDW